MALKILDHTKPPMPLLFKVRYRDPTKETHLRYCHSALTLLSYIPEEGLSNVYRSNTVCSTSFTFDSDVPVKSLEVIHTLPSYVDPMHVADMDDEDAEGLIWQIRGTLFDDLQYIEELIGSVDYTYRICPGIVIMMEVDEYGINYCTAA